MGERQHLFCLKTPQENIKTQKRTNFPGSSARKESARKAGDPGSSPGSGSSPGEGVSYPLQRSWVSLVAQLVKNPPATQETWVQSPGERKGYPLQYSGLANPSASIVHGHKESDTSEQLSVYESCNSTTHKFLCELISSLGYISKCEVAESCGNSF